MYWRLSYASTFEIVLNLQKVTKISKWGTQGNFFENLCNGPPFGSGLKKWPKIS